MSRHDVAVALEAMQDETVRTALAGGDLSALGGEVTLDEHEQDMVAAAARDYPEVEGYARYGIRAGTQTGLRAGARTTSGPVGTQRPFDVARVYAAGGGPTSPFDLR